MSAYVIVFVEETSDVAEVGEYRRIGLPTLKAHGAEMLLRMASAETTEGPAVKDGVVMLRFPDLAKAKAWYNDPAYQEALQHRYKGAKCHAVIVADEAG